MDYEQREEAVGTPATTDQDDGQSSDETVTSRRLKAKYKDAEERYAKPMQLRLHRSISWLKRAELEAQDYDAQFIFLWIAFNAAYARELGAETHERDMLAGFISALLSVDGDKRLHSIIFERFTGPIRTLIENRFVFEPFWRALREFDSSGRWEAQFSRSRKSALRSVLNGQTGIVLGVVFDRLYVLRNQLIHGGATWNSSINRAQVRDGSSLMMELVPVVIDLMLDHPNLDFGEINYPVV